MNILETKITGAKIIQPKIFSDDRGFFLETFQLSRYTEVLGSEIRFLQDNFSRSKKGVLRGLHFQTKNPQGKLVRVTRGKVFDVIVDIRKDSLTYGIWDSFELSEDNFAQLWIPPGLAHGFLALSDVVDFEYKCTNYYDPKHEDCLIWNDSTLGINWPLNGKMPLLSEKDKLGKNFLSLK